MFPLTFPVLKHPVDEHGLVPFTPLTSLIAFRKCPIAEIYPEFVEKAGDSCVVNLKCFFDSTTSIPDDRQVPFEFMHLDPIKHFGLLRVGLWGENQFTEVLRCSNDFIISFFDFSEYFCRLWDLTIIEAPVSMLSFKNDALICLAVELLVVNLHAL